MSRRSAQNKGRAATLEGALGLGKLEAEEEFVLFTGRASIAFSRRSSFSSSFSFFFQRTEEEEDPSHRR